MTSTEIKTIELIVNSEQARKRLDELKAKLEQLKAKREEALERGDSRAFSLYSKEIKKVEKEIERTETKAETLGRALGNLDKSAPNELKRTLRELQKELNSGKVQRGSAEWQALTKAIRETKDALDAVNRELRTTQQSSWSDRLTEWGNKWMGLVMNVQAFFEVVSGVRAILQQAVSDYADIEEAKAQVRKYTGLAAEDVDALNESLKAMDTRTSREQLNALAGDAGKLGITSKDQILDFVEAADKINVALGDDLGAGAVKNVGKLAMLFEEDKRLGLKGAMLATASVINELSQNSSAGAGYLEEFTARVAGVGKQAGLTQAQIMGFAAVLDESMQEDATSATAFSQLITKMYQEPAKFAALAGKSVKEFSRLLKEDANGALIAFLGNMKAQGGFDKLAPMFEQMGLDGTRATSVLSSVADKLGNVERMQRLATEAYSEAVSINNEFAVQNSTVQAGLDKAKKSLQDMRAELGEKLMPVASKMVNFTTLFLKTLSALITWVQKHYKSIIAITAAIVVYNATLKATVAWEALHNLHLKAKVANLLLTIKTTTLYKTAVQAAALAQGLFTVAVTLFTKGVVAARIQFVLLTAAMAKNPIGLIAVALSTVIGLVLQFTGVLGDDTEAVKENTEALKGREKAIKDCNDASKSANEKYAEEGGRIEKLNEIIHDNTRSIKERRWAIAEIQKYVPDYHASLSNEGTLTERNTEAIKDYLVQLKKKALAEALYEKLKEAMSKKADADMAAAKWDNAIEKYEKTKGYTFLDRNDYMVVAKNPKARRMYDERTDMNYSFMLTVKLKNDKEKEDADAGVEEILSYAKQQGVDKMLDNLMASGGNETDLNNPKGTTPTLQGKGKKTDPVKEARDQLEKEALARKLYQTLQYQQGLISRREYEEKLLAIEQDMVIKQRDLYQQGSKEWNELEEKRLDMVQRVRDQQMQWSMQDIARQEAEANAAAQREYLQGTLSEEQYQQRLDEIKLAHLRKRADYYTQFGDPEKAQEFTAQADAEDLRQQMARRKDFLQKAKAMENEYFQKSLDERQQDELRLLDELVAAGVISEEKKQEYITQIQKKYDKLRKDEKDKKDKEEGKKIENPLAGATGIASDFTDIFKKLESLQAKLRDGEESWEDYAAVAVSALAFVSTALSSVAQLFSAQQQEEENAITRRYDNEIKKVGENSRKGKKLEEQKQKELAAVKNKYRKKQMALEIAQAVASTAMAAINAYASASKVSWILGPIAAAMAVAAGGIQIAAIKKQHAAESSGYYSGGFTGGSDYHRRAGIVHQGEFVASHLAVQNPNVLPFLRLIDHAQRNNTIASLSAADVSRAIAAPQATANAATATAGNTALQVVDTTSGRTADAIARLNENLEAGIRASVSITGDDGFERQWERYNKMKNRK
ncbi:MAG: phage tail tape measure protein [Bacteroidaceae bacterium]